MASEGNTHFLNTTQMAVYGGEYIFHPFQSLPKELRLDIWELALPRQRMIHISLKLHEGRRYDLADAEPPYVQRNHLRKPISGERYRAVIYGNQLNSKFLYVNREARGVALGFYRVHMPVYLTGPTCSQRSTFYFNPEHDFLHITADAPVKDTLIDFLWDLKAYDPKDIGLLKLAVDLDGFCANDLQYLKPSDLFLIRRRSAFVQTLSQLKEVWFINLQSAKLTTNTTKPARRPFLTSTRPILGSTPTFQRAGTDRRPGVERELEQVYMGAIDPREIVFRWRRLLRTWAVDHESGQTDYRLLIGSIPGLNQQQQWNVRKLNQAVDLLTLGESEAHQHDHQTGRFSGTDEKEDETGMAAVGFWLFPLEAIGEIREGDKLADMDFYPGRVVDMRNHWPELVLSKVC